MNFIFSCVSQRREAEMLSWEELIITYFTLLTVIFLTSKYYK